MTGKRGVKRPTEEHALANITREAKASGMGDGDYLRARAKQRRGLVIPFREPVVIDDEQRLVFLNAMKLL